MLSRFILLALSLAFLMSLGCTRRFFRHRADAEVGEILAEKNRFPFWQIENFHVYPNPMARFADPSNPDRPPMPPDDPAARLLGPNPQRVPHAGIARIEGTGFVELLQKWDEQNRHALRVEAERAAANAPPVAGILQAKFQPTPDRLPDSVTGNAGSKRPNNSDSKPGVLPPPQPSPRNNKSGNSSGMDYSGGYQSDDAGNFSGPGDGHTRPYRITMDQCVELGVINSREFQTQRENLYLSALPVTNQRFAFAAQFFALEDAIRESTGRKYPGISGQRWRANSTLGFTKLFSTGALLLFAMANNTVVELSGSNTPRTTSISNINFDIIQPLLRGGGRAVTLEPLTLAERNLLYQIRNYARFRKQFYQSITGGITLTNALGGVSIGGGGLSPGALSGLGADQLGLQVRPGTAGTLLLSLGTNVNGTGYLSALLQRAQIASLERNVRELEKVLELYQGYEEGGEVSSLQVDQVKLQLLQGQAALLDQQRQYRDALDSFKLQLGVPVNLLLDLDDGPVRPINEQIEAYEKSNQDFDTAAKAIETYAKLEEADLLPQRVFNMLTRSDLVNRTNNFRRNIVTRWDRWKKLDVKQLENALSNIRAERRKILDQRAFAEEKGKELPAAVQQRLRDLERELPLGELELALRRFGQADWKMFQDLRAKQTAYSRRFRDVSNALVLVLGEATNERMLLISPRWPQVPAIIVSGNNVLESDLESSYQVVTETALANRLDLMNTRAQVMDAWRQIAVFANSLLGTVNIGYHMDVGTPTNVARPLAFEPSRARHQLYFNGEAPLVRLVERNNYRASLIAYQRARRALMAAEDIIARDVRSELRQLRVLAQTYEIQRQAVQLNFLQVESALETFRAPAAPGGGGNAASAAALTNQLLQAIQRLTQSRNQILSTWISYQIVRQQLYLDLEQMPLDPRGVWIDDLAGIQSVVNNDPRTPRLPDARLSQPRGAQLATQRGISQRSNGQRSNGQPRAATANGVVRAQFLPPRPTPNQ